jgi:uncharacterized membrane-anchored protein
MPATDAWRAALLALATMLSIVALLTGVDGLAHRAAGRVSVGALISAVLVAVVAGLVVRSLPALAGRGRRPWLQLALVVAGIAAALWPQVLWPQDALRGNAFAMLTAGLASFTAAWLPVPGPAFRTPPAGLALSLLLPATLVLAALAVILIPAG